MSQSSSIESFDTIGKHNDCYKYTPEISSEFIEWWQTTQWFETQKDKGKKRKTISWGSQRKAQGWEHFVEGASRVTGDPKIICIRCDTILTHPAIHGTSGMTEHPVSRGCNTVARQRNLTQVTIVEGFREKVLP